MTDRDERLAAAEAAISELCARLARLEDPDRFLNDEVACAVGGRAFSARALFRHAAMTPDLRAAFRAAGIRDARTLGKALQRLSARVDLGVRPLHRGTDAEGAVWSFGRE